MKHLLALSLNCNGFPLIEPYTTQDAPYLFGIASYSHEKQNALIFKDLYLPGAPQVESSLFSDTTLGSAVFLEIYESFLDRESPNACIQPFQFHFAGRDWLMVCHAELVGDYQEHITLESGSLFQPAGATTDERISCWLMQQFRSHNAATIEEFTYMNLMACLQKINSYGILNILISDGNDLIAYRCSKGLNPMYMLHSTPPHKMRQFEFPKVTISFEHHDLNNTFLMFTNIPPKHEAEFFKEMKPGQTMAVRQGNSVWDSHQEKICLPFESAGVEKEITTAAAVTAIGVENPLVLHHVQPISIDPSLGKGHPIDRAFIFTDGDDSEPAIYYIKHESIYRYEQRINISKHIFRFQPVHDFVQHVLTYKLTSSVNGKFHNYMTVFGNTATCFDICEPYNTLILNSQSLVSVCNPLLDLEELKQRQWTLPLAWMPWDQNMLEAYLMPPELPESELYELFSYAMSFVKKHNSCLLPILDDINQTINREFTYLSGSTTLATTPFEVYLSRKGVCQDFANLFICLARLLNIPARYRVGYIYTGNAYDNKEQGDATHGWVEVYLPTTGWMGFDPTNACHENKNHVRVAAGRSYRDATPTSGTIFSGGGRETLVTTVQMIKLHPQQLQEWARKMNS
jgi:hypothetical protein